MNMHSVLRGRFLPGVVVLWVAGCGGGEDAGPAASAAAEPAPAPAVAVAQTPAPDACKFLDRDWLEQTLGWELYEGDPETMMPGEYACDFDTPPKFYVTRSYPDPALPEAIGFNSLAVNTHPMTEQKFKEFREMLGDEAEDVAGIGDGAYTYGFDMLYVRVGDRGFSLRIYTDARSEEDRALVQKVLQTIAREGAARL